MHSARTCACNLLFNADDLRRGSDARAEGEEKELIRLLQDYWKRKFVFEETQGKISFKVQHCLRLFSLFRHALLFEKG